MGSGRSGRAGVERYALAGSRPRPGADDCRPGLVLVARRRGVISSARQVIGRLRDVGMYLSDAVADRALALVGE